MDTKLLLEKNDGQRAKDLKVPGFYTIWDQEDNVRYVGSTDNIYNRHNKHQSVIRSGQHENKNLQEFIQSSSGNLRMTFEITPNKEVALDKEQDYLNRHHGNGVLLNISRDARAPARGIGNNLGSKQSPEHKASISRAKMGHVHSEETKQKIGQSHIGNQYAVGHKRSEEMKIESSERQGTPVAIDGKFYRSQNHAAAELNVSVTTVANRCNSNKFPTWSRHGR